VQDYADAFLGHDGVSSRSVHGATGRVTQRGTTTAQFPIPPCRMIPMRRSLIGHRLVPERAP
jgi:hypothetical protein